VTEETGPNPEVPEDRPAAQSGADPQPEVAPGEPRHGPEESAVAGEAAAPAPAGRAKPAPRPSKARKAAAAPATVLSDAPKSENMNWYILKVQSNREESIREGLLRRVSIQGLDRFFGEVIVPTEKVTEFKGGKKRVIKRKLYPGYIVVHMEINEDTWFLVRETPGIGDFTGASGVPSTMLPHEVERIIAKQEEKSEKAPDLKIPFAKGDRVKVIDGNFENFEGEVDAIDKTNGRVTVMITIFNRTTPVEFEYWQVESV
jgi:transcriptional antiterminator NusG